VSGASESAVTGIRELFAELSGADEFEQEYQLELFGPALRAIVKRERLDAWRDQIEFKQIARTCKLAYWKSRHERKRTDPQWLEQRRESNRAAVARYRARRKAAA
jgi:hypothetical protein